MPTAYTPRYTSLVAILQQSVAKFGDKPAIGTRKAHGWEWTSFRQLGELVDQARAGIAALGAGPGDRVAVIANNRLEWAICAYACYTRGIAYVPMYEAQLDKERQYILHDSGTKLCFVANEGIEKRVRAMQADLPELQQVINFDGPAWKALLESGKANPIAASTPNDSDIASIIYTSGTTGNPKGVRLTHYNLAANVAALLDRAPVREGDRSLAFLPWAHVFGGTVELNALLGVGGQLAICDNTDKLLGYLPEVKPTMLFAVPRIWNRIYDGVQKQMADKPKIIQTIFHTALGAKSKLRRGETLSLAERLALPVAEKLIFSKVVARFGGQLRFAFSGAAALSREVAEFIDNLGIQVYEGYGMTESSGGATANFPGATRLGSVGKAIPGVEIRVLGKDGNAVPVGEEGEIVIYGTGVMAGYHNLPEATTEALRPDGGLRSGDLGRLDKDDFLFITGRVKELYKLANGRYVAPAPLEEKLQLSPFILQAVVYGDNQPHNVALIVPDMAALKGWAERNGVATDPNALLSDNRTHDLVRKEIESCSRDFKGFESVTKFVLTAEELTPANNMLTPTLKLKRRNVLAKYEDQLKALYTHS
jgi:long-chain acyl-CoA synthetase